MAAFFSITLTLFFVIDSLGNIPIYLHLIKKYDQKHRRAIAVRELFFALLLMLAFQFIGDLLLSLLDITSATVQIAGGIMLFVIAIRLIFSTEDQKTKWREQEPFIVPLATPIIAGPSVLAIIMVFAQAENSSPIVLAAVIVAWLLSAIVFLCAEPIYRVIKDKGLDACQRLMGLIVALIAVQLFLEGVAEVFK
jgi:multiple antibiotic resistance protein